jgi:hypothetical protein
LGGSRANLLDKDLSRIFKAIGSDDDWLGGVDCVVTVWLIRGDWVSTTDTSVSVTLMLIHYKFRSFLSQSTWSRNFE